MTLSERFGRLTREALQSRSKDELIELVLALAPLVERVETLEREVAQLKARLGQNSQNSSKPPSTDPPGTQRPQKESSGRAPGGQPGHPGVTRAMAAKVDEVVDVKPAQCGHCGVGLKGSDPQPHRHQVTELPQVAPQVTEYRLHTLVCGRCGHETGACLPEGVPVGQFGPQLLATVGLLTGAYHLSKRTAQEILRDLFGVRMSLGAVSGCEQTVSNALAAAVRQAHEWVQAQRTAHADETGWRERRHLAWLWVMTTRLVTVFKVHARRNREAARSLLGCFRGVLHSDRWAAYNIHTGLRQLCWAHLLRDFTAMGEVGGRAGGIGRRLVRRAKRVLKRWHRVRDGTWSRRKFLRSTVYLRKKIERDLAAGAQCGHAKTEHSCRRILKLSGALWTFAHKAGVEPTNNAAERAIRPAVLWRKRSFGTHSARGSRFAERMLTTFMTLKQQQRPVVDYVREACQAFLQGQRVPSLVPISK
jgi:transposase